jgi:hypothetical protein
MRCNAEVEAFAEADVMPGVMKFVFEVDQINVHLHGLLQIKAGLLVRAALLLLLLVIFGLDVSH